MEADLEDFVRAQQDRLLAVLALRTGNPDEAEEIAQEALLRLVRHWHEVRGYDAPAGWLHRVAANLATSRWRRARTALRLRHRAASPAVHVDADAAEVAALRDELRDVPPRQREALLLRHVAGLPPDEVAAVMHTTPQAVRNLTHRGARTLQQRLTIEEDR